MTTTKIDSQRQELTQKVKELVEKLCSELLKEQPQLEFVFGTEEEEIDCTPDELYDLDELDTSNEDQIWVHTCSTLDVRVDGENKAYIKVILYPGHEPAFFYCSWRKVAGGNGYWDFRGEHTSVELAAIQIVQRVILDYMCEVIGI